ATPSGPPPNNRRLPGHTMFNCHSSLFQSCPSTPLHPPYPMESPHLPYTIACIHRRNTIELMSPPDVSHAEPTPKSSCYCPDPLLKFYRVNRQCQDKRACWSGSYPPDHQR